MTFAYTYEYSTDLFQTLNFTFNNIQNVNKITLNQA